MRGLPRALARPLARLWPRTLLGRTVLVLLFGVIASNLMALAVYSGEREDALTSARARQIAEQVATAATALGEAPPAERRHLLRAMRQPGLRLSWSEQPAAEDRLEGWRARLIVDAFRAGLGDGGAERLRLSFGPPPSFARPPGPPAPRAGQDGAGQDGAGQDGAGRDGAGQDGAGRGWSERDDPPGPPHRHRWAATQTPVGPELRLLVGSLRLDDGTWLNFSAPIATVRPFWATPFFLVVLATTGVVLAASVWAVRRATQPLAMFAQAAERLGRDMDAPPLSPGRNQTFPGPLEVERAAHAFNRMQEQLQRFVRQRTQMLAAISHDLRTPLTRLRLRAELIDDEEQQRKTIADLDEMAAMIEAALAFARDQSAVERAGPLDLAVLLQTVCEEAADGGADATYQGPPHAAFVGRPGALKRAFANLVDNAVEYGRAARVGLEAGEGQLCVCIDDDGPGIPEAELERVFEPFARLEGSRSRNTGGVGLGLALVRAAIGAHGGTVTLVNRAQGGLRARVRLPAAGPV
jgi:signal transduction histidine kinase